MAGKKKSLINDEWHGWSDDLKVQLLDELTYNFRLYARKDQLPPDGDWLVWALIAGRGAGKTRAGAEYVKEFALENPGCRIGVVAPTYGSARDVCVEGESGLLAIIPPNALDQYSKSFGQITFKNGSMIKTFSGSDPERLRGPQHHLLWCDEVCAWPYADATWDMAQFGLRLGDRPRTVVTTTPRPIPILKRLMNRANDDPAVQVTRASTFANAANLPPSQLAELQARYGGTYLGQQELEGLLIEDVTGALWRREWIDSTRIGKQQIPTLERIVIGLDPAISSNELSDMTGIIVLGRGVDGHGYVLDDLTGRLTPEEWATAAVEAYRKWQADRIIAEANQGGEMVEHTIRTVDPVVPVHLVYATRGKLTRAEPVSALYEQRRVHHTQLFPDLEDELCTWVPGDPNVKKSPDRLDALVWAAYGALLTAGPTQIVVAGTEADWSIPHAGSGSSPAMTMLQRVPMDTDPRVR